MCQYQTLYFNDKTGYAVRCRECEKIQVAYSNLVMTFEKTDFDTFHDWIKKSRADQPAAVAPGARSIMIPSPCQGMQLLLSYNELNEFCEMLEAIDSELQSLVLLELFDE